MDTTAGATGAFCGRPRRAPSRFFSINQDDGGDGRSCINLHHHVPVVGIVTRPPELAAVVNVRSLGPLRLTGRWIMPELYRRCRGAGFVVPGLDERQC